MRSESWCVAHTEMKKPLKQTSLTSDKPVMKTLQRRSTKFTITTVPISHKTTTKNVLTIAVGHTYLKDKRLNRHHLLTKESRKSS